ncbi:MAG: hypothetical protein WBQ18_06455 [Solirubrobacteraceae bacterium]
MHRQLATELAPVEGRRGLVISASKEIEPGVRAMLVFAEGLFRLDVRVIGDSVQTFLRNHTGGRLDVAGESGAPAGTVVLGAASAYGPGRADLGFTIGTAPDRLMVRVTIGTLRFAHRGTVRVSAQAVVRQAPVPRRAGRPRPAA